MITVSGQDSALSGALVYLFNPQTGKGLITRAADTDGKWAFDPITGKDGDKYHLWAGRWEDDGPSSLVCFVVDKNRSRGHRECH
jgi:hypothetical protein